MRSVAALACLLFASGCASTANDPRDPWEPLNRATFEFNDAADRVVLKPVAEAYESVVPAYGRARVNNFFDNLEDLGTSLNNALQGKLPEAINDLGRVVVNTTFGVLGLWDVASDLGVEKNREDFGQTLGAWGVGPGPYFVIPLLGPSTARDAPARAVDPSWYYGEVLEGSLEWGLWGLDQVRSRANLLKAGSILEQAALDRYTFVRDAWLQRRRSQVYDGRPPRLEEDD